MKNVLEFDFFSIMMKKKIDWAIEQFMKKNVKNVIW